MLFNRLNVYLILEKQIAIKSINRFLPKSPAPTDFEKLGKILGPKAIGPKTNFPTSHNQQTHVNSETSIPSVHKESKSEENADLSSNNWSNKKSITEQAENLHAHPGIQKGTLWAALEAKFNSDESVSTSDAASPSFSSEQALLNIAEKYGLTTYEKTDKNEGGGFGGSPKLTTKGLNSFSEHSTPPIIKKEDIPVTISEDMPFKAGLLFSDPENILLTPIQTHIVVVFSVPHDRFLAVGILTSQKNQKFLSKSQIYNSEKGQYFRYLRKPKVVPAELFEDNQEATDYVNQQDHRQKLNDLTKQLMDVSPEAEIYNGKTVTAPVLQAMIVTEFENENNKNSTVSTVQTVESSEVSNIKDKDIDLNENKDIDLNENKDNYKLND